MWLLPQPFWIYPPFPVCVSKIAAPLPSAAFNPCFHFHFHCHCHSSPFADPHRAPLLSPLASTTMPPKKTKAAAAAARKLAAERKEKAAAIAAATLNERRSSAAKSPPRRDAGAGTPKESGPPTANSPPPDTAKSRTRAGKLAAEKQSVTSPGTVDAAADADDQKPAAQIDGIAGNPDDVVDDAAPTAPSVGASAAPDAFPFIACRSTAGTLCFNRRQEVVATAPAVARSSRWLSREPLTNVVICFVHALSSQTI